MTPDDIRRDASKRRLVARGGDHPMGAGPARRGDRLIRTARGKPQAVKRGEVVLIDCGCAVHGYQSDISRSFVFGADPTREQRRVWDQMRAGQQIAMQAARIGATAGSVDDAVRAAYTRWGYGPGYKLPGLSHRTGHGIGMEGHEPVNLVHGETTRLAPGMCFSNEPGIYLPGKFGIRLEDCFHMTAAGPRWFSTPPASIDAAGLGSGLGFRRRARCAMGAWGGSMSAGSIGSSSPSHFATTVAATALPTTLVADRPMSRKWSIARMIRIPASGMLNWASVAVITTRLARGTPAMPFEVIISVSSMAICVPIAEVDAIGLGDEDRREGHVHHRPVEVERIAQRKDEAGDPRRHAEAVERFQRAREGGFRRGGRESEHDRIADVAHQQSGALADDQEADADQQRPQDDQAESRSCP